jgi:hypothetical protein
VQRLLFTGRRADQRQRAHFRPVFGKVREKCRAAQYLAADIRPDLGKRRLDVLRQAAGHPRHHVTPFIGIARVAQPLVGHRHAAGIRDAAINDDSTPVIAQMEMVDLADLERAEHADRAARVAQTLDVITGASLAAHRIDQHAHLDALLRAGDQRAEYRVAEAARLPGVGGKGDAGLRGPEICEHAGEPGIAVVEQLERAALEQRNTEDGGQRPQEFVGVNRR